MTKTAKIVLGVAGALFLLALIAVSFGIFMIRSAFQTEQADSTKATAAFEEVRARFPGVQPAFELRDNRPTVVREPPATAASPLPQNVRVLVWDTDEGRIARITLPFSVLKWSQDPIEFEGITLEVEDVQRYGRTLLLEGDTPDGDHVLVWTD